jgi:hypothetical protein
MVLPIASGSNASIDPAPCCDLAPVPPRLELCAVKNARRAQADLPDTLRTTILCDGIMRHVDPKSYHALRAAFPDLRDELLPYEQRMRIQDHLPKNPAWSSAIGNSAAFEKNGDVIFLYQFFANQDLAGWALDYHTHWIPVVVEIAKFMRTLHAHLRPQLETDITISGGEVACASHNAKNFPSEGNKTAYQMISLHHGAINEDKVNLVFERLLQAGNEAKEKDEQFVCYFAQAMSYRLLTCLKEKPFPALSTSFLNALERDNAAALIAGKIAIECSHSPGLIRNTTS